MPKRQRPISERAENRATAKASETFEQQIHRIYDLLQGAGVEVTWNDHVPDPDNPSQARQIDITIRREGKLTLVECRLHRSRQGVKWIEELMGRRQSLRADAVIAVSASGFTRGALNKAEQYDVALRDLHFLTDDEVRSWGRRVALTLYFYQYSDLELSLLFARDSLSRLDLETLKTELRSYPGIQSLFNAAAKLLGTRLTPASEQRSATFGVRLDLERFHLCGERVVEVDFRGKACLISQDVACPVVQGFGAPGLNSERREAIVERFSLGETSIVHDENRISVLLDISQVRMPPFCQFRFARLTSQEEREHEVFELVGVEKLWVPGGNMNVSVATTAT
jgi:hypothetical protein